MNELPHIVREQLKVTPAGDHPDPNLLAAFAEQALPDRERTPLLEHLARCADCRSVLVLAAPPLESAARSIKDTAATNKAPWFSWPVLRWGAVAACVVVVGTAVLMQRNLRVAQVSREVVAEPQSVISGAPASAADAKVTDKDKDIQISLSSSPAPPAKKLAIAIQPPLPAGAAGLRHSAAPPAAPSGNNDLKQALRADRTASASGAVGGAVGAALAPALPTVAGSEKKDLQDLPLESRNMDYRSSPQASETAETRSQAQPVQALTVDTLAKAENPGRAKAPPASAQLPVATNAAPQTDQTTRSASALYSKALRDRSQLPRVELRWNISSDGQLQRSLDAGKTWQPVVVSEKATFRALSVNGPDIWVGGAAGLLYHSYDAGARWTQVKPATEQSTLTADIAAIEFTDQQHGKLTVSNGDVWITTDAGQTWRQQP